ncbi:MAG: NADH-quinone oxidoreductase subunit A [Armatimonadota bacterium]
MPTTSIMSHDILWHFAAYAGLSLLLVGAIILISHLLGERHRSPSRDEPYESGIRPTGTAHFHFNVQYYLVAVFFVIFDVEAVIIIAWAVAVKQLGWAGYAITASFIITLAVGLVYIWKLGGLDWYKSVRDRIEGDHR